MFNLYNIPSVDMFAKEKLADYLGIGKKADVMDILMRCYRCTKREPRFIQTYTENDGSSHSGTGSLFDRRMFFGFSNSLKYIEDGRRQSKVRHTLKDILAIVLFAMPANADDRAEYRYFMRLSCFPTKTDLQIPQNKLYCLYSLIQGLSPDFPFYKKEKQLTSGTK